VNYPQDYGIVFLQRGFFRRETGQNAALLKGGETLE
jgi:hypothetical protein